MRYFSLLFIIFYIMILSGCVSTDKPDINELTDLLNENESININLSSVITTKRKYIEYLYYYNEHIIFKAYANDNNSIIACTITTDKQEEATANELFKSVCKCLLNKNSDFDSQFDEKIKNNTKVKYNSWSIEKSTNPLADYYLIADNSFEFETENLPTLNKQQTIK